MIGKDPSSKAVGVGILLSQQTRGKGQIPEADGAGYFRELTQAATNKDLKTAKVIIDENEMMVSDDQIENSIPDALQTGLSSFPNPASFNLPVISQIVEARFHTGHLTNTIGTEPLGQSHLGLGRTKAVALPQLFVFGEGNSNGKVGQNTHQDHDIHSVRTRQASPKAGLELPAIALAKASPDLSVLPPNLPFQMPVNSAPAQVSASQIADMPELTGVRIEHAKRNSTGVLTSIELVLEPAELGRITARIQHEAGRLTLILSAEHKHVADDLAKDSGLLLRVLGDHLPNVDRMSVHVQTGNSESLTGQGQLFSDFNAPHKGSKGQGGNIADAKFNLSETTSDDLVQGINTTLSRILV